MKFEKVCILTKEITEAEDTKQEARTKPSYFTRMRKMSFSELAYYILHPGKESTRLGLTRFFKMIGNAGIKMSEQAFSKARSHFSHCPFEKMVRETTAEEYRGEDMRTWNGYYLFAIDGTTVALPDKPSLCKSFGGSGRKKDSATASASILYDIENDWIADAAIEPYPTAERTQAMGHILRLKELGLASQSLVLFDRGYPEAKLLAFLQANEIHFLMRWLLTLICYLGRYFKLTSDLKHNDNVLRPDGTLSDSSSSFKPWTPIGTIPEGKDSYFSGTFDGQGIP